MGGPNAFPARAFSDTHLRVLRHNSVIGVVFGNARQHFGYLQRKSSCFQIEFRPSVSSLVRVQSLRNQYQLWLEVLQPFSQPAFPTAGGDNPVNEQSGRQADINDVFSLAGLHMSVRVKRVLET